MVCWNEDADRNESVSRALTAEDYRVTLIASTGGFLRRGQSTLLIGVEDERVNHALEIIRDNTVRGKQHVPDCPRPPA